jgi:hypothetical protein
MARVSVVQTPPPVIESKHDKFVRLAEPRVAKTIKMMQGIAKLSNRHAYEYSEAEVAQIVDALEAQLAKLKDAFVRKHPPVFTLKPTA